MPFARPRHSVQPLTEVFAQPLLFRARKEGLCFIFGDCACSLLDEEREFCKMNPWKKKCLTLAVICSLAGTSQVYAAEKSRAADSAAVSTESLSTEGGA